MKVQLTTKELEEGKKETELIIERLKLNKVIKK
jgi:hypothetical protein